MKKAPRTSPESTTAGFSTIEALVALLLVALVGLVAVQATAGGLRAAGAGRARAAESVRLLQLDSALRRAVGAVVVPCWAAGVEPADSAAGLSLPCSGGEAGRTLRIRVTDGWVELDTLDAEAAGEAAPAPVRVGPFSEAAVAPLFEEEQLWGVQVTVRMRDGDAVELRARIGSRPLLPGDGR